MAMSEALKNKTMPAPAPSFLIEFLEARETAPKRLVEDNPQDDDWALHQSTDFLNRHPPVLQGGRNDAAFKAAAMVRDFGTSYAVCLDLMTEWNHQKCSPLLEDEELERTVQSVYENAANSQGVRHPSAVLEEVDVATVADGKEHPFIRLNKEFAFVLAGNSHHILWETVDPRGKFELRHLQEGSFHKAHASKTLLMPDNKVRPLTIAWMQSPQRRSYKGIVFKPGSDDQGEYYNLWRGFDWNPTMPLEAPPARWKNAVDAWVNHAIQNVCGGDKALGHWLISWFAHIIQRPAEKPLVAVVFKGAKGTGKNALVERVGALFPSHFLVATDRRYVVGNFNSHLERLLLFVLDEAFWSGDKQAEGNLKGLITGAEHVIELKGQEPYKVDNYTRIAIIGNEDWLVPATADERRFAVFDVGNGRKQDRAFFREMREAMEAGGYQYLLRFLMDYDIKDVDLNQAPDTQALTEQKLHTLEVFPTWWMECVREGKLIGADAFSGWPTEIAVDTFRRAYQSYHKGRHIKGRVESDLAIGRMLAQMAPGVLRKRRMQDGERAYYYEMPNIDRARDDFERYIGSKMDWATSVEDLL